MSNATHYPKPMRMAGQIAKVRVPDWYLALGPDVEYHDGIQWRDDPALAGVARVSDWTKIDPKRYRAKPREVVTVVNGVEYRWPETVKESDPPRERFSVCCNCVLRSSRATFGEYVHYTREGAESQLAAIQAAAKGAAK